MTDIAIRVENLSKRYRIGKAHIPASGGRSLLQKAASPFRYLASTLRQPGPDEIIWALKAVSFQVKYPQKRGFIVGFGGMGVKSGSGCG